jgi:hypothetical protein
LFSLASQMDIFIYLIIDSFYYCRNCADRHHSDELEVLLSAQGSHHHQSHSHRHSHPASPVIPPQLSSSLLTMQDHLGFQWSNCGGGFLDTSPSTPPTNGQLQHDGHDDDKIEAEGTLITNSSRPSCAGTATIAASCHDVVLHGGGGGGTVLPTINISLTTTTTTHTQAQQQQRPFLAAPPPLPGDAFEILLASSRLCKTLLLSQAAASSSSSSVLLHDDGTISTVPSLRSESEHVAYGYGGGPPPPAPAAAHRPRGRRPSVDNYKQQVSAAHPELIASRVSSSNRALLVFFCFSSSSSSLATRILLQAFTSIFFVTLLAGARELVEVKNSY